MPGNPRLSAKKSSKHSSRLNRLPYKQLFDTEIDDLIHIRKDFTVYIDNFVDVTPKFLHVDFYSQRKYKLFNAMIRARLDTADSTRQSLSRQSVMSHSSTTQKMRLGGLRLSLEDILKDIGSIHNILASLMGEDEGHEFQLRRDSRFKEHRLPFIRVILRQSPTFLLYESASITVAKGTPLGDFVEEDNRIYDYLTIGRGNVRRRSEAETQTNDILTKTRFVNTYYRVTEEKGSYMSFYELYDTYKLLSESHADEEVGERRVSRTLDPLFTEDLKQISKSSSFHTASMVMERLLAGNIYGEGQKRFRNINLPTKFDNAAEYRYQPEVIFTLYAPKFGAPRISGNMRKAVSDISFCYGNGDILAVAYGVFSYSALITVSTGDVCIWSIKNPHNPERAYRYNTPVTSVEFSPFLPFLLAIGMYDGTVEVRNITKPDDAPISVTQRTTSLNRDPVVALKWIQNQQENEDTDPVLALSSNGTVWRYCVIRSPHLLSFKQVELYRMHGQPEGLQINRLTNNPIELFANRHPLGLNITLHPHLQDIYYLLTDEGCIYKCSTNTTLSYLDVWQTHDGAVNCMDFSPWSPKLFLTCGNDWCIRIWMDGIQKPLVTLKHKMIPIYTAQWSRTHSTVIISTNRSSVDVWDIQRNLLTPMSRTKLGSAFNTMFEVSLCGHNLAVGNERGDVNICSMVKMPFPPHFQYDELKKSLFKAISTANELIIELNNIGFFGYPGKGSRR
uniref:Dynein axonemal intermediate chain 4 n=1 Tax=Ceratitis capitata TaxID=7213 RepID=W8AU81_CERCA